MNDLLTKAIKRELVRKPSIGFSDKVMNSVFELKTAQAYQPIISKPIWIVLGILAIVFIVVLLLTLPETTARDLNFAFFDSAEKYINSLTSKKPDILNNINLLVVSGISLAVFLLLFFDSLLFKKQ